jgi:hypothetical protein
VLDEVCMLAEVTDPSQALLCRGFAADTLRLRGDMAAALRQAELGLTVLRKHRPTTYYSLFGIVSVAAAFLAAAEREVGTWPEMRPLAGAALSDLRRFALMIPIARPCVLLLAGRSALLDRRSEMARRRFAAAVRHASDFRMRGAEAAARRAFARAAGAQHYTAEELPWA